MPCPCYSAPAVADGVVYVGTSLSGLYAFDAAGSANCSAAATAKTCAPLWTASIPSGVDGTPAVAGGVVYVASGGTLSAFAAARPQNCPGTGAARTCTREPLWTSAASNRAAVASPTVANGVVYVSSIGGVYGYDAAGSLKCPVSGTAKTCSPLWSASPGYVTTGSPAVVNGVLYIDEAGAGTIYAYSL